MSSIIEYLPALGSGLIVSLNVALLSLLFASIIGFLVAIAKLSKVKIIRFIATSYTVMVRGVPDLVMMFLIFYGGQIIVNNITLYLGLDYFDIDAFYAGVFTLSFIFGAFMAETFRASILALDKQQLETAYAFGMTKTQVKFRILIPQMLLHALPSFTNNWLVLIKSTAILSIIGLHDMIFVSNLASRSTHQPFIFYFLVSLAYLLITWLSIKSIRKIEDHYNMSHQV